MKKKRNEMKSEVANGRGEQEREGGREGGRLTPLAVCLPLPAPARMVAKKRYITSSTSSDAAAAANKD